MNYLDPKDIARMITEDPDLEAEYVYGYRSIPEGPAESIEDVLAFVRKTDQHKENYFSYKPIFYYHTGNIGNLVETKFDIDDPNLGGYGDSQPFYEWIIGVSEYPFDTLLPDGLMNRANMLRKQIKDEYFPDWSFAGMLPNRFRKPAIELFKQAREYLVFKDVATDGEFTYIGPYDDKITTIIVVEFISRYKPVYDPSSFRVLDKYDTSESRI